jgi:hypothetical protein
MVMGDKENRCYRLSEKARALLKAIAKSQGVSMTAVLESAVRQIAKDEGIKYENLSNEDK